MIMTIVNNLFTIFLLYIYNLSLYGKKDKKNISFYLAWGILFTILSLKEIIKINIPILNIIICIVPYMVITYVMYRVKWKSLLTYTFYYYICAMLSELLTYTFLNFLLGITYDEKIGNLIQTVTNLFLFVIIRLFLTRHSETTYDLKSMDFWGIFIVPFGSIYLLLVFCNPQTDVFNIKTFIAICIILLFNISSYYMYVKTQENIVLQYRADFLEKKNKDYIKESKKITELWQKISEFQHDSKYFSELDKVRYSNVVAASGFGQMISKSGCVMVDAIINNRASYADEFNISFELNLKIAADVKYISDDISILLYNLIDNAIDANKVYNGERFIKLSIKTDIRNERSMLISISNPYEGVLKKNNNGDYITSKADKHAHGIGLRSVKQIVEKHDGEMFIEDNNNVFRVNMILFNMDSEYESDKNQTRK